MYLIISPRHISGIKKTGFTAMPALHFEKLFQIVNMIVPVTISMSSWTFWFSLDAFSCFGGMYTFLTNCLFFLYVYFLS